MAAHDDLLVLRLCRSLSGFDDVSERFAHAAIDDLMGRSGADTVDAMLRRFEAGGAAAVATDAELRAPMQALLTFLYTGFGVDRMPADTPENHYESLMWRAALAHPPALSGGYFGHWSYPPDEANG